MKKFKRILALCLTFGLLFTACSKPAEKKNEQTETKNETRVFKDDLGREVTLKQKIDAPLLGEVSYVHKPEEQDLSRFITNVDRLTYMKTELVA